MKPTCDSQLNFETYYKNTCVHTVIQIKCFNLRILLNDYIASAREIDEKTRISVAGEIFEMVETSSR